MTAIVFNPTAQGDHARRFIDALGRRIAEARLLPTQHAGHATELAAKAVEDGATTVVAAGGDGTVNEVLNGLALAHDGFHRARLAVLPFGTVNVFAKELGIPGDLDGAWETAVGPGERSIDVACMEWDDGRRRRFVQMAGAGLDSLSISRVRWGLKKRLGPVAYLWSCIEVMFLPRPRVLIEAEAERLEGVLAAVGNGRYLGGRYPVFPRASLEDGLLDLVVFPKVGWFTLARVFPRLWNDTFADSSDAVHRQVASLRLSSPDPLPVHVEGDNVGHLPVTIRMEGTRLRVAAPAKNPTIPGRRG